MNEWDHWAVLTSIRAKSKHILWRPGHSQKRPEPGAAYIRNGTSPPQKIPLPPHSAFPQFILVKASRGPWQVSHPLWLTSHSFIHSLIQQSSTVTYCMSIIAPGPGEAGRPDSLPASPAGVREEPAPLLHSVQHATHQASSSEIHGFSIFFFLLFLRPQEQQLRKSLSFHLHYRIFFF